MFAKSLAALPGAAAARAGSCGRWTPGYAQLARRGPWLSPTARPVQVRTNSTVVDRPAVYNDGMPPPPPAPAAAQRLESRPASDFQAFKSPQAGPEPSVAPVQQPPVGEVEGEGADAHTEANRKIFMDAVRATAPRNNWTRKEVAAIYYQPMLELAHQAVSLGFSRLLLFV